VIYKLACGLTYLKHIKISDGQWGYSYRLFSVFFLDKTYFDVFFPSKDLILYPLWKEYLFSKFKLKKDRKKINEVHSV
jgi:hypothetical protein